ncbi:DUF2487 family protein [Bacillus sp. 165]|uniref:DUF2487 family protein n=1 Tax=Bacillus sp. 165 TaxID=1529117 RepID=UPI001ADCBD2D|nr:DUF2487 family protein [Bacillus sp. 165]MBO9128234.1 DUF2487 family protein [Bacillus sp. 165]
MEWTAKDIQLYKESKEYIDTVVVPLVPVSLGADIEEAVQKGEFVSALTREIERQYKGRILLVPSFTYLQENREEQLEHLQLWTSSFMREGMKHIVYVTSDFDWKKESDLQGMLFWLPALPLEQLNSKSRQEVLQSQVNEMMKIVIFEWEKAE